RVAVERDLEIRYRASGVWVRGPPLALASPRLVGITTVACRRLPARRRISAMTAPFRIDVHHHILPTEYVSALARINITGGGGIPFPRWSVEDALALMDRHGIQAAVTSISSPGVHFGDAAAARDLARRCNEISARLVSDHPDRFGAFATLPLPDVD